jgi:hypothetical protein
VAPLSQGRTAAVQCGLFTHKSVPVIFEQPVRNIALTNNRFGDVTEYISVGILRRFKGTKCLYDSCR